MGLYAQNVISFMKMTAPNPIFKPNFQYMGVAREHESYLDILVRITTVCEEN